MTPKRTKPPAPLFDTAVRPVVPAKSKSNQPASSGHVSSQHPKHIILTWSFATWSIRSPLAHWKRNRYCVCLQDRFLGLAVLPFFESPLRVLPTPLPMTPNILQRLHPARHLDESWRPRSAHPQPDAHMMATETTHRLIQRQNAHGTARGVHM